MCAFSSPDNRDVIRRYVDEIFNGDRAGSLEELVDAGYVFHCPDGDLYGPEGARLNLAEMRLAFPDLQMEVEDTVAEGNLVSRRFVLRGTHLGSFMGIAPTGMPVTVPGMAIDRIEAGRIAETWITFNLLELVRTSESHSDSG